MDGDLLLIFSFVIALALIVFPFAMYTHRKTIQHDERKLELLAKAEEAKSGGGISREAYQKLEERVRVLERIATDSNSDLAAQIEHLRDLDAIDLRATAKEEAR